MSFNREKPANETCRDSKAKANMEPKRAEEETHREHDLFNSLDFERFLNNSALPSALSGDNFLSKDTSDTFLSKDDSILPSWDYGSGFNSRDAFSDLLTSDDWILKSPPSDSKPAPKSSFPKKTFSKTFPEGSETKEPLESACTSREWLPLGNLGNHVDVPYSCDTMFDAASGTFPGVLSPRKTDWEGEFFAELQLMPPPISDEELSQSVESQLSAPFIKDEDVVVDSPQSSEAAAPKKKRIRKPRKKIVPDVKIHVEPTECDVLLGRGGKSNHHAGNKRFREEVGNLKLWYKDIEDKDEKTDLSQCLVNYVHSYNGRFLEKDPDNKDKWYVIPNIVARRKASQALREDTDPEKRAAKRARFLERKKAKEAPIQQKK